MHILCCVYEYIILSEITSGLLFWHQTTTDLDRAVGTSGVEASLVDVLRQTRDLSIVVYLRKRLDLLTRVNHPDDERTTHAHRYHLQAKVGVDSIRWQLSQNYPTYPRNRLMPHLVVERVVHGGDDGLAGD